jgi:ABC-type Fe3+-hydroxamate transport system substrate-binding protein
MAIHIDQTGRSIELHKVPQHIVSLVPSQTELLYSLSLTNEVVGITKFCVHPSEWFRNKTRVGGTKQLHMDTIHQLHPDLIIANKEENVKEQVEQLASHYPVWISDVNDLESAYEMIVQVGAMTGRAETALQLIAEIKNQFTRLQTLQDTSDAARLSSDKPRAAYLIWRDPYMTVGGDTFIHCMLEEAGFDNVFKHRCRYPEIAIEELRASGCEWLLLSSEPFPFQQKHADELRSVLPGIKILLVDGEMFSWYGSRLLHVPDYFRRLMNEK